MTDTQHEAAERVSDERVEMLRSGCLTRVRAGVSGAIDFESDIASALTELLALRAHDAGQAGVVVKPLEWKKFSDGIYTAKASPLGVYSAHDGYITLKLNGRDLGRYGSLPEAQAAAQSHFDQAILSALSPAAPIGSLFGDALASAGQSIGMSVTRVHPKADRTPFGHEYGEGPKLASMFPDIFEAPAAPDEAWRYSINYGPDGEENYANVYDGAGHLVSNLRIHHAIAVVNAMNSSTPPVADAMRVEELSCEFLRDECAAAWDNVRIPGDKFWVELPTNVQVLAMQAFRRGVAHASAALQAAATIRKGEP